MKIRDELLREFGLYFTVSVENCKSGEILQRIVKGEVTLQDLEVISTSIEIAKNVLTVK